MKRYYQYRLIILLFVFLLSASCRNTGTTTQTSSESRYHDFVTQVQMQQVFPSSKDILNCIPRVSKDSLVKQYEAQKNSKGFNLKLFVLKYYNLPVTASTKYTADSNISIQQHISSLWGVLTRNNTHLDSTILPLPYPYIVPGGMFNEIYYWDSYFTCLGLQTDKQYGMINNMVANFAYLIDTYGFIPNGNRKYFLSRSQPPFFSYMVDLLSEIQGDSVVIHYLPELKKEYAFWMKGADRLSQTQPAINHSVLLENGKILNRYWDNNPSPRQEAFRIDSLNGLNAKQGYKSYYRNIRSACESGWDFSSRWFADGHSLSQIETTHILPVDLNVLLWHLEKEIAKGALLNQDSATFKTFKHKANQRKTLIQSVFWDKQAAFFMDYNFVSKTHTQIYSLAGIYPLFDSLATAAQAKQVAQKIKSDFLYPFGLITTTSKTDQQWDYPNGWAPLQWISIKGLQNYHFNELAKECAMNWIAGDIQWYKKTGKLVEKYNVVTGVKGQGGEYPGQDGFGWTNGVLQKLMYEYHVEQ